MWHRIKHTKTTAVVNTTIVITMMLFYTTKILILSIPSMHVCTYTIITCTTVYTHVYKWTTGLICIPTCTTVLLGHTKNTSWQQHMVTVIQRDLKRIKIHKSNILLFTRSMEPLNYEASAVVTTLNWLGLASTLNFNHSLIIHLTNALASILILYI